MAKIVTLAKQVGAPIGSTQIQVEGDPIAVHADGESCGTKVDIREWIAAGNTEADFPDTFYVIDIPGMPKATALRILGPWTRAAVEGDPEFEAPDEADRYVVLGRYRWKLGVNDKLPGQVKSRLRRDRFIVIEPYDAQTIAVLNDYIVDRTGLDVWITDTPVDP